MTGETSRAFPKFESYGMLETAASVGWKVKDAIVGFHGIGRLVACVRRAPCADFYYIDALTVRASYVRDHVPLTH